MIVRHDRFIPLGGVVLLMALTSPVQTQESPKIDFVHDVAPLLKRMCRMPYERQIQGKRLAGHT